MERNLSNEVLTENDQKYMVQTLTVMLMSYEQKPSLSDCEVVSKAVYSEYTFLEDDDSVVCYCLL